MVRVASVCCLLLVAGCQSNSGTSAAGLDAPHADAWEAAIDRVTRSAKYGGLSLTRQVGLAPLGPDPESGLEEFALVETGKSPKRSASTKKFILGDDTGLVFVLIPGGTFTMGAQYEDPGTPNFHPHARREEGPPHTVTLAPFLLSKYEMTQGQWQRVTDANPSLFRGAGTASPLRHPVEQVGWNDCEKVLGRLDLLIPTEAQWEYACRATTATTWWTGKNRETLRGAANAIVDYHGLGGLDPVLAPVGVYRANRFGLHDVHGNVWEWCRDVGDYDVHAGAPDGLRAIAQGPVRFRVARGGSFNADAYFARCAYRCFVKPDARDPRVGIRPSRRIKAK